MAEQQQAPNNFDDSAYNSSESSGTYGEQEKEIINLILEVRSDLENFEHRVLRGQYEFTDTRTGEKYWKKFDENADPIINEIGIREIMGRLLGYCTPQTILGYFEDDEIYKNMFYFDMSLSETFAKRCDLWELDIESAKAIKDACIEFVQSILFRARSGFTAINLKTVYSKSDITRSDNQQKQQRSFLGIPIK